MLTRTHVQQQVKRQPKINTDHPLYTETDAMVKAAMIDTLVSHGVFQVCMQQHNCERCPLNYNCPV